MGGKAESKLNDSEVELDFTNPDAILSVNEVKRERKVTMFLAFCLIVCSIGCSFQVGWNIGVLNTPVNVFKEFCNETYEQEYSVNISNSKWTLLWSVTNGLMPLGATFGGLASGNFADYFGRKKAIFLINLLVLANVSLFILAYYVKSYVPFILARFIVGGMCGLFTGVGTMYLSEIAPRNLRGAAGTLHQLSIVIGILSTNIMGLPELFGTIKLWPLLFAFQLVPTVVQLLCLPFCVETPKYVYIKQNNSLRTRIILRSLRGSEDENLINDEMNELEAEKMTVNKNSITFKELIDNISLRRALVVTVVIQMAQQYCGINTIALYSTNMFISIGLDANTWAVYATIIIDSFKVLLTLVCMMIIEIAGRRKLLLVGLIGMSIVCLPLAALPVLATVLHASWLKYLTVLCAMAYVTFFSIGPGAIPWLITSELFPSNARGKATSVAVLVNWLSNFIVSTSIPLVMDSIHNYIYLIFGVLIWGFIAFIYKKVPETKDRSIDDIKKHFDY